MILTRVNGMIFPVSNLFCAYHHVPLSSETQKLTSCFIGGRQRTCTCGFYGFCGLLNCSSRLTTIDFDPLIKKKQAITFIVDTIMRSQNKNEMFTVINKDHTVSPEGWFQSQPQKLFFFLKKSEFLGHVLSPVGVQLIAKRVEDLKNLKPPQSKGDVIKFLGCFGFYSYYIKDLHVDSEPFNNFI